MAASNRAPRNRLQVPVLASLLDERKALTSRFELDRLAERYNMDGELLERLARYVNTPSVSKEAVRMTMTENNEQVKKMLVGIVIVKDSNDSKHSTGPLGVSKIYQMKVDKGVIPM
jgi:hypothetical protein